MAKKPKPKPEAETESVKPSETRAAISQAKLRSLLKSCRNAQADITEISGTMGEKIKNAIENDHLHRKAFGVIRMAYKMEPEKLADFLDNLEHYLDISGLNERAAQVQKLDLRKNGDEEDADEGNVKPFPRPMGEAAE